MIPPRSSRSLRLERELEPNGPPTRAWVLYLLVGTNTLVEVVLLLSDLGLIEPRLRSLAYEYGAFWAGLLTNWRPNFPWQPATMFLTYGFLHAGFWHLSVNMLTLASLGSGIVLRVGQRHFLRLYVVSLLGGALCFGLLVSTPQPMMGASGALFGLAAAWLIGEFFDEVQQRRWRHLILQVLILAGMNLILWWAMDGHLAWQAHLGGFMAGGFYAVGLWGLERFR